MSEAENAILARRFIDEAFNNKRSEAVRDLLHPKAVFHLEGFEVRGPEGLLPAWASALGAFPDLKIIIQDLVAQGDSVALRWTASGMHTGPHLGIAPSMKLVAFRGITWLRFSEGKIVEQWESWNQGRLFNDLQQARKD